jgi:hypothetical protein
MHPLEARSSVGGTCRLRKGTAPGPNIFLDLQCADKQRGGTDWVLGHGFSISAFMAYLAVVFIK